jgi:MGT family glycosyltransferase
MSRILAYTSPARGHLYPIVPILRELQHRGHTIALRTLSSQVATMRELGLDADAVMTRIEQIELDDYKARSLAGKGKRVLSTLLARARHELSDLRVAIEAERPDALLVDCMTWGALAVAQTAQMPWAEYVPYPIPLPSRDTPAFGPGLKPARGRLGCLRDRALGAVATAAFDWTALESLNTVRAAVGAAPLATASEVFALAPLVLYLTAEPFEYRRADWPVQVRMVGPCAWDPPAAEPRWLSTIERPLVLVTTSSERQRDRRLVTTALRAFTDANVEVVATLPADGVDGIEVPNNAHVERFLPHTPLLARAACAITHGGAGVTQKALAAGVPVCVVPFGRDQLEVARRVEVAGAGTRLSAARLTPSRLRWKVHEAIALRSGARALADAFAAAGGPSAAADAFEALVDARSG